MEGKTQANKNLFSEELVKALSENDIKATGFDGQKDIVYKDNNKDEPVVQGFLEAKFKEGYSIEQLKNVGNFFKQLKEIACEKREGIFEILCKSSKFLNFFKQLDVDGISMFQNINASQGNPWENNIAKNFYDIIEIISKKEEDEELSKIFADVLKLSMNIKNFDILSKENLKDVEFLLSFISLQSVLRSQSESDANDNNDRNLMDFVKSMPYLYNYLIPIDNLDNFTKQNMLFYLLQKNNENNTIEDEDEILKQIHKQYTEFFETLLKDIPLKKYPVVTNLITNNNIKNFNKLFLKDPSEADIEQQKLADPKLIKQKLELINSLVKKGILSENSKTEDLINFINGLNSETLGALINKNNEDILKILPKIADSGNDKIFKSQNPLVLKFVIKALKEEVPSEEQTNFDDRVKVIANKQDELEKIFEDILSTETGTGTNNAGKKLLNKIFEVLYSKQSNKIFEFFENKRNLLSELFKDKKLINDFFDNNENNFKEWFELTAQYLCDVISNSNNDYNLENFKQQINNTKTRYDYIKSNFQKLELDFNGNKKAVLELIKCNEEHYEALKYCCDHLLKAENKIELNNNDKETFKKELKEILKNLNSPIISQDAITKIIDLKNKLEGQIQNLEKELKEKTKKEEKKEEKKEKSINTNETYDTIIEMIKDKYEKRHGITKIIKKKKIATLEACKDFIEKKHEELVRVKIGNSYKKEIGGKNLKTIRLRIESMIKAKKATKKGVIDELAKEEINDNATRSKNAHDNKREKQLSKLVDDMYNNAFFKHKIEPSKRALKDLKYNKEDVTKIQQQYAKNEIANKKDAVYKGGYKSSFYFEDTKTTFNEDGTKNLVLIGNKSLNGGGLTFKNIPLNTPYEELILKMRTDLPEFLANIAKSEKMRVYITDEKGDEMPIHANGTNLSIPSGFENFEEALATTYPYSKYIKQNSRAKSNKTSKDTKGVRIDIGCPRQS